MERGEGDSDKDVEEVGEMEGESSVMGDKGKVEEEVVVVVVGIKAFLSCTPMDDDDDALRVDIKLLLLLLLLVLILNLKAKCSLKSKKLITSNTPVKSEAI
jgi:hypothetical protein